MTAEIAILNRSAVAIASDSAVTITVGNDEKIYNSAEKVFEFSKLSPIGLMVHNSLDFMGFPWDVLVRKFRQENDKNYRTVREACDAFLSYVRTLKVTDQQEDEHLELIMSDVFVVLYDEYMETVTKRLALANAQNRVNVREMFHAMVRSYIDMYKDMELPGFLKDKSPEDFKNRYKDTVRKVAGNVFQLPLEDPELDLLDELSFAVVKSGADGNNSSGLVFTGYAQTDFFPSIYALDIDGQFFGEVKSWETDDRCIDRGEQRAIIAPFAQREMVDRFVYGIDDDFEHDLVQHIGTISQNTAKKVLDFINSDRKRKIKLPSNLLSDIAVNSATTFQNDFLKGLKSLYLRDIYEIITAMPKAELAQMAESLVSLTSMKRHVSLESETVGGPVDVAIITRSEGFVWIKRKLYFDKEMNPGFFHRHFKEQNDGTARKSRYPKARTAVHKRRPIK